MKNFLAILIALVLGLLAASAFGQITPTLITGYPDGQYSLKIENGVASVNVVPVLSPNSPVIPGPVVPGPVIPPQASLQQSAANAIAAIQYTDKETNIRQLAFLINFVLPNIPNNDSPTGQNNITALKETFKIATGDNTGQWAAFWAAVDPYLQACTTNAQFVSAVKTIQQALADSLPDSSEAEQETFGDFPTYGAQADMDGKLGDGQFLAWLLKNLPAIIAIIKMFVPQIPNIPLPF